jgi:hypothetical protein
VRLPERFARGLSPGVRHGLHPLLPQKALTRQGETYNGLWYEIAGLFSPHLRAFGIPAYVVHSPHGERVSRALAE